MMVGKPSAHFAPLFSTHRSRNLSYPITGEFCRTLPVVELHSESSKMQMLFMQPFLQGARVSEMGCEADQRWFGRVVELKF